VDGAGVPSDHVPDVLGSVSASAAEPLPPQGDFRIHLWTGVGLGIYVVLISVSGSAIVFRNELCKSFSTGPKLVPISGPRLSRDALKNAIHKALPQYDISYIFDSKRPNEAAEVWLDRKGEKHPKTKGRLFDPFTGKDLGPSVPQGILIIAWFSNLHTNLLAGQIGRKINGVISILVVLLCVSGLVIWWPGPGRVRRSLSRTLLSSALRGLTPRLGESAVESLHDELRGFSNAIQA
jgi:uncharacterized iron-regulated membrane protein